MIRFHNDYGARCQSTGEPTPLFGFDLMATITASHYREKKPIDRDILSLLAGYQEHQLQQPIFAIQN